MDKLNPLENWVVERVRAFSKDDPDTQQFAVGSKVEGEHLTISITRRREEASVIRKGANDV